MNEKIKKALDYIIKRKKLIGKKINKDQQSLELLGEYQSSDKQWFGWCDEFGILSYIETILNQAEENEKALKIIIGKRLDLACINCFKLTQEEYDLVKKVVEKYDLTRNSN